MSQTLHIKNMVCPRCIASVGDILAELNIQISQLELGEVKTVEDLSEQQSEELAKCLAERGFELLQDHKSKMIAQIKAIIIETIHLSKEHLQVNYSTLLSEKLHHDYASLSRLFSSVEGLTIEKFVLKQKIERVKELIFYDEMNLSEIAYDVHYSSVAHLSTQFKKETGMTPSQFKKLKQPGHSSREQVGS
ncbi:AraC family transcriptional regulator [Reichenbachiella agarivorans]|uniref:AraC family transcriptional regulator n=1 Tax=Reichenbachiella agarivorans TaxID=2979464 RepID=A0ABY6CVC0_9BACT|nr:AraC family transcriptional regulator [Reichenbachiella agarivorans]UXP33869.1 AraC family transcriptional regulator [Reichenbachiella agarivorans]